MSNDLHIEQELAMPISNVWEAWTDPVKLQSWLCHLAELDVRADGRFELFWEPENRERNSTLGCSFKEVRKNELLSFSWKGPEDFADLMNQEPLPTSVAVEFEEAAPGRTRIRLIHRGWGTSERWQQARQWHDRVWRGALSSLEQLVRD